MGVIENLNRVQEKMEFYGDQFGHKKEQLTLVGVTKFVDEEKIRQAIQAGLRDVGENRVQEIVRKEAMFCGANIHMIGQLQTNKINKLPESVKLIQSIDRRSLLEKLQSAGEREKLTYHGLIQVNPAKEIQKGGILPEDLPELLDFAESCSCVKIEGLMMVAPFSEDLEEIRPYFREMRNLFEKIGNMSYNQITMNILSMGMSHDYSVALEEGSNMIRVGSAIFGARDYSK